MENFKNLVPIGLFFPFLIIILLELLSVYLLGIIETSLNNKIALLEERIKSKEEALTQELINNENFMVFSQMVDIVEILRKRNLAQNVIDKFNSLMPKFLSIEKFSFDNQKKEIVFVSNVNNLTDYVRFLNYLNHQSAFEVKSITPPNIAKETGKVNFSVTIKLKEDFYK